MRNSEVKAFEAVPTASSPKGAGLSAPVINLDIPYDTGGKSNVNSIKVIKITQFIQSHVHIIGMHYIIVNSR